MWLIYDNLTATVVAGTVVLLLMAMQMRVTQLNIEQTATYMSKKYSLDFADWLQDDLLELGANMDPGDATYDPVVGINTDSKGRTTRFTFFRDSLNTSVTPADTVRIKVRYVLKQAGTRTVDGEAVELFEAVREQKVWSLHSGTPPPSWTVTGRSVPLLKDFEIEMRNRDGERIAGAATWDTANPDTIQQTHVRFAMASPFKSTANADLGTMRWGASLLVRQ